MKKEIPNNYEVRDFYTEIKPYTDREIQEAQTLFLSTISKNGKMTNNLLLVIAILFLIGLIVFLKISFDYHQAIKTLKDFNT